MAQIYVHIVSVNNIQGVEKNGKFDPYVIIKGQVKNGKFVELHKTRSIKKVYEANYFSEVVIDIEKVSDVILFEIMAYNYVMKDTQLGTVTVPVSEISGVGELRDYTIEGGGILTAFLALVPCATTSNSKLFSGELPTTRLHVERLIYFPGELVKGHLVVVCQKKPKEVQDVVISIESNLDLDLDGTATNFVSYAPFAKKASLVCHGEKLGVGVHIWSFEFSLPTKLPPSLFSLKTAGAVLYNIIAYAPLSWVDKNKTPAWIKQSFCIAAPYHAMEPKLSVLRSNAPPHKSASVPGSFGGPGQLHFSVAWTKIPKILLVDHKPTIAFTIQHNMDGVIVNNFKVKFVMESFIAVPSSSGHVARNKRHKICLEKWENKGLAPGTQMELSFKFPSEPSNTWFAALSVPLEMCPEMLEVAHYIEVQAIDPSGKKWICDQKPVFWAHPAMLREEPFLASETTVEPSQLQIARIGDLDLETKIRLLLKPTTAVTNEYMAQTEPKLYFSKLAKPTYTVVPPARYVANVIQSTTLPSATFESLQSLPCLAKPGSTIPGTQVEGHFRKQSTVSLVDLQVVK